MGLADYSYSNTRIRVMKSLLLTRDQIKAQSNLKNLEDFVASLQKTYYAGVLSGLRRPTVAEIERILKADLIQTIKKVAFISPPSCQPLMNTILMKYEFDYIKYILNALEGKVSESDIVSRLPWRDRGQIFREKETEDFLDQLLGLSPAGLISAVSDRYPELRRFMLSSDRVDFITALDKYYYSRIQEDIANLKGSEKNTADAMMSLESEITNIMILLRSVVQGRDPTRYFISSRRYHIRPDKYIAENVLDALQKLLKTPYGPVLVESAASYAQTKSLLSIELALKKYLLKQTMKIMDEQPFGIGFIIAYIRMKEIEVENLLAVCNCIKEEFPPEKTEKLLLFAD